MDKGNSDEAGQCPVTGVQTKAGGGGKGRRQGKAGGARALAPAAELLSQRTGLLGLWQRSRHNILEVIPEQALKRPILSGRLLRRFHVVSDPEGMRAILKTRIETYPKSRETKGLLAKVLKHGLFVIEGAEWRWQRRAMAPVFAPRNIAALGPTMTEAAEAASARLAAMGPEAGPVNFSDEMMEAAFDVIAAVTFRGADGLSAVPLDVIKAAIEHYLDKTGKVSLLDYLGFPTWVPRPGRIVTHRTLRALKKGADAAIAARRANPQEGSPALIDLMIAAEDAKTGRRMNDIELRDNLITMLIAGHETTAVALSWALYLLALDPEAQARARAEAQAVLGGRAATVEDVPRLDFIRQVLFETLRLYPPIGMHLRTANGPDEICGAQVRKGDVMLLPFYALHRHKKHWRQPDHFIPERFADMEKIDKFAYLPFSAGPRVCIGADFAIQESIIILATLLSRFGFETVAGRTPKPRLILTLRPEGGVWLTVTKLAASAPAEA